MQMSCDTCDDEIRQPQPEEEEIWKGALYTSTGEMFLEVSSLGNTRDYFGNVNTHSACGGYRYIGGKGVHYWVAREHVFNPRPDIFTEVDHINGDKADNRACNLRHVNRRLNMMAVIGPKGWIFRKFVRLKNGKYVRTTKRYMVQIKDQTGLATRGEKARVLFRGFYATPQEARAAYIQQKHELFKKEYKALTGYDNCGIFPHHKDWYDEMELCGPTSDE